MKTKIILAALMVVGVLSGKTEKTMNETLNQKQQALVAVAACEAKDDQKTLEIAAVCLYGFPAQP